MGISKLDNQPFLTTLVHGSPIPMMIVDQEGILNFCNPAALELFGYREDELVNQPIEQLIPKNMAHRHQQHRKEYIAKPSLRKMASGLELTAMCKDGHEFPVEVTLNPVSIEDHTYVFCTVIDLSLILQAKKILTTSDQELEATIKQRTRELYESEQRYHILYDQSPDMYVSVCPKTAMIIQSNMTTVHRLGYKDKSEIIGMNLLDMYHTNSQEKAKKAFLTFSEAGEIRNEELSLQHKDGSTIPVMLSANSIRDAKGKIIYSISCWRDISDKIALEKEKKSRIDAEHNLTENKLSKKVIELNLINHGTQLIIASKNFEEALQACLGFICTTLHWPIGHVYVPDKKSKNLIPSGIWHIEDSEKSEQFKTITNQFCFEMGVGLPGRVWESHCPDWIEDIYKDDNFPRAKVCKDLAVHGAVGFPVIAYEKVVAVLELFSYDTQPIDDELLKTFHVLGTQLGSVFERKQIEDKLEKLAHFDLVTALPNRGYFLNMLDRALSNAKRQDTELAVLFLDLNGFKNINDSLGHDFGDQLLRHVADRLSHAIRNSDFIGRLGGDEFIVLAENLSTELTGANIANRLIKAMEQPFLINGRQLNISVSIGIAQYPTGGDEANELIQHADLAMYQAKSSGQANYHYYTEQLNTQAIRRIEMEQRLRNAIAENNLYLVYQPQIDLRNDNIYGVEVLLRWNDPQFGEVSPEEFIPIAESSGIIHNIGQWVITHSLNELNRLKNHLPHFDNKKISINCSVLQLQDHKFYQFVEEVLKEAGIHPDNITFEITESVLMKDIELANDLLLKYRKLGLRFSVDDFGTGYSSMNYLKQLPISVLKIDKIFISQIDSQNSDKHIAKAMVQLAHALNMEVVAEGIETEMQKNTLRAMSCDFGQGFYFAKGLGYDEFKTYLEKNHNPSKVN